MAEVGEIKAKLTLDAKNFKKGMDDAKNQMDSTTKKSHELKRSMTAIQTAALAIGGAVVAGIGGSVAVAATFEQAMARVAAVSGATGDDFESLKNIAEEMGAQTEWSATQAAEALTYLSMAGFKVQDQIKSLPAVLALASSAQIDLGRSADIVSNIMTGFGISADETGHAVDVLVKTMTTANTDLPQLGDAMKFVAPVAKSLGLSIEETAAAVAKMSDAGKLVAA
jgi:TP901 family phage tail tape measure protein